MNRRSFIASTGAAVFALKDGLAPAAAASPSPAPAPHVQMKLGDQTQPTTDTHVQFLARYGIRNICGYPEIGDGRLCANVDELKRLRDLTEKYDVAVDMVPVPFLASTHIDKEPHPAIMLADSPERDRDIEAVERLIRNCATAGIPAIKYNMNILGGLRTGTTPGRGDAMLSTWRAKDSHPSTPLTRAGVVDADRYWERITYFLDRVI